MSTFLLAKEQATLLLAKEHEPFLTGQGTRTLSYWQANKRIFLLAKEH
jgi:uncharacterized protein YhfF